MPIGFANLGASANPDFSQSPNQAAYSGTSWTPPNSGLILCFVVNYKATLPDVPTMSGNRIDWLELTTIANDPGTAHRITLFGGIPTGSVTGITGVQFGGVSQLSCDMQFIHVTGSVDLSGGVADSIVQAAIGSGTAASGLIPLAAASNANNRPVACFAHLSNEATEPLAGWTEADDMSGVAPTRGVQTQWKADGFETPARASWDTSTTWIGLAVEIKAAAEGSQTYDDTLTIARDEAVSDRANADLQSLMTLSEKDGVTDGMTNSILSNLSLAQVDGVSDGQSASIPKVSALNKVLTLSDLAALGVFPALTLIQILSAANANFANMQGSVGLSGELGINGSPTNNVNPNASLLSQMGFDLSGGLSLLSDLSLAESLGLSTLSQASIFPALMLIQVLSQTPANFADMQGSVGLSGDLGISGDPQNNVNSNASLLSALGVNLSGGLSLLSNLTIAEKLGFSLLGNVGVYPSLTLGRDLAFVPANIALIGGDVSLGQALGLIDVPNLDAQAALSFLRSLGINLSSELSTNQVEAILALAHDLGISTSAQLNSFPLVGIDQKLFLVDANNANMLGSNVLSEIRALNILGGIAVQENVAIPIDFNLLTSKLVSIFGNLTVADRLGISDSAIADMQAAVSLGEVAGMGNAVNQLLNAGLTISVVGSVLTISGINVIIVKGFVFTSDSAKNSLSTSDVSRTASGSDSAKSSIDTGDS